MNEVCTWDIIRVEWQSFENKADIETTTHRRLLRTFDLHYLGSLPVKTKVSTFSKGFKQDQESHNVTFKISRIQPKIIWHIKNY